jgi:hypothetical protein
MTDQAQPEGGALPADANASPEVETKVEAKGSEAESSPAAAESEKPEPKKDGEWQRNKELTRRWREEQRRSDRVMRENEELARELKELRQRAQAPQQTPHAQQQSQQPAIPDELVEQKANEILARREAEKRRAQFESRVDDFASEHEDYDTVVTKSTPISDRMAEAIMASDIPGELLYYLGKNADVALKIYDLPLAEAAKEIGRIEDRLIAERKKLAEKPVSKAPPPVPKIDASTASERVSTTSPDSDKLSDEEWFKAEQARIRRKAARKPD